MKLGKPRATPSPVTLSDPTILEEAQCLRSFAICRRLTLHLQLLLKFYLQICLPSRDPYFTIPLKIQPQCNLMNPTPLMSPKTTLQRHCQLLRFLHTHGWPLYMALGWPFFRSSPGPPHVIQGVLWGWLKTQMNQLCTAAYIRKALY